MTTSTPNTGVFFGHGRLERVKPSPGFPSFLDSDEFEEYNNTGGPRHVPGIHVAINFERRPNFQFSHGFGMWKQERLSSPEIAMLRFINCITDKPHWHTSIVDYDVVKEWKELALSSYFTDVALSEWCFFELLHMATGYSKAPQFIFALNSASRICKSDRLVRTSLLDLLKRNTDARSISPWLYPFIFAQSPLRADGSTVNLANIKRCIGGGITPPRPFWDDEAWSGERQYYSIASQWLASDFEFTGKGNTVRFSSPINQLHPTRHKSLYTAIERLISDSIPEWNQVLLYKSLPRNGPRVKPQTRRCTACVNASYLACSCTIKLNVFKDWINGISGPGVERAPDNGTWSPMSAIEGKYTSSKKIYDGISLSRGFENRGLQVYIELANVELNPDGSIPAESSRRFDWDLNGNRNERIVATTLVCLRHENIEPDSVKISFRSEIKVNTWGTRNTMQRGNLKTAPSVHSPVTGEAISPPFQELVTVSLPEGRIITFPNVLQHKFQPLQRKDTSKPGHVQFLAIHLVDPHYVVCSTSHVPPQSVAWWWEAAELDLICVQHKVPEEIKGCFLDFAIGEGSGAPSEEEYEASNRRRFAQDNSPEKPQEERPIRIEAAVRRRLRALEEHESIMDVVNRLRIYGVPDHLRQRYRQKSRTTVPLDQSDPAEAGYPEVNTLPENAENEQSEEEGEITEESGDDGTGEGDTGGGDGSGGQVVGGENGNVGNEQEEIEVGPSQQLMQEYLESMQLDGEEALTAVSRRGMHGEQSENGMRGAGDDLMLLDAQYVMEYDEAGNEADVEMNHEEYNG